MPEKDLFEPEQSMSHHEMLVAKRAEVVSQAEVRDKPLRVIDFNPNDASVFPEWGHAYENRVDTGDIVFSSELPIQTQYLNRCAPCLIKAPQAPAGLLHIAGGTIMDREVPYTGKTYEQDSKLKEYQAAHKDLRAIVFKTTFGDYEDVISRLVERDIPIEAIIVSNNDGSNHTLSGVSYRPETNEILVNYRQTPDKIHVYAGFKS